MQSTSGAVLECTREGKPVGERGCGVMLSSSCWTLACQDVSRWQDASAGAALPHTSQLGHAHSLGGTLPSPLPVGHYVLELQRVAQEALVSKLACSRGLRSVLSGLSSSMAAACSRLESWAMSS